MAWSPDAIADAVRQHLAPLAQRVAVVAQHPDGIVAVETEDAGWNVEPVALPEGTPFRVVHVRSYEWSTASGLTRALPALALLEDGRSFDVASVDGIAALITAMHGQAAAALARLLVAHHSPAGGMRFVVDTPDRLEPALRERVIEICGHVEPRWTSDSLLEFVTARAASMERRQYDLQAWAVSIRSDGVLWQLRPVINDVDAAAFRTG